jgi:hypothetical protein
LKIFWSGFLQRCRTYGAENHPGSPPSATRDRFSFPTGRGGFRQKSALILFPEAMHIRHPPPPGFNAKAQRRKDAREKGFSVGQLRSLFCKPDGSGFLRFAPSRLCVFALISSPPAE